MISFRDFIIQEAMAPRVFNNTTINQMKAIAKNAEYKTARFTVSDDGKYHAGDAGHFNHTDLLPHAGVVDGHIMHHGGDDYSVSAWQPVTAKKADTHPAVKKIIKKGIPFRPG